MPVTNDKPKPDNVCPECGYQFQGNGFDGIDADRFGSITTCA
jgi:hypothetical protein